AVFAGVDRANRPYDADPKIHGRRARLQARRTELLRDPRVIAPLLLDPVSQAALGAWEAAALPPPSLVYAASADFKADGSFAPARGCRPIHMLRRGDIKKPGAAALPGALACVPGLQGAFKLARPDDEGQRRAALARW